MAGDCLSERGAVAAAVVVPSVAAVSLEGSSETAGKGWVWEGLGAAG